MHIPKLCNIAKSSIRNKISNNFVSNHHFHGIENVSFKLPSKTNVVECSSVQICQNRFVETQSYTKKRSETQGNESNLVSYDDPDTFGLIGRSSDHYRQYDEQDEGDIKEDEFINQLPLRKDKLPMQKYIDMIKLHVANMRIKEAIDVLEVRMLKEDRVKPDSFIYNVLVGSCARVGYTHKAFQLFNDMKKRGLKVSGGVYTSLFNACANSPWKDDGIKRATQLRQLMIEKSVPINTTIYNSMIKAYGRCGDIKGAFEIVDEMIKFKIPIRNHTFNFLLQACISNKESGFRSALITWRKMLSLKEKPNIYSFNLMLRCIKECGFGDNQSNEKIIDDLLAIQAPRRSNMLLNKKQLKLPSSTGELTKLNVNSDTSITKINKVPNFLAKYPDMQDTLGIGEVKSAEDRFLMTGGFEGILKEMNLYYVKPDIKTFTQLLELVPKTLDDEIELIKTMDVSKIKKDINFCNVLMKRRCFRQDFQSAKDVLTMIEKENKVKKCKNHMIKGRMLIKKDIITYGILALCCDTKESAEEYLQQLSDNKIKINAQIIGSLLKQALHKNDFDYISLVMKTVKEQSIPVNTVFMDHLNKHWDKSNKILAQKNYSGDKENYKKFIEHYEKWTKKLINALQEEPNHPWEQFRVNQTESYQRHRDHVEFKKKIYRTNRFIPRYAVKS